MNNFTFSTNKLNLLIGENLGIETISIIFLLTKKYNFICINKTEKCFVNADLENNILTHSANSDLNLKTSNFCLLIGINTRFESPSLNIKLRHRAMQGNFKVYSINSFVDLSFASKNLGNSLTILKQLAEGNHQVCQELNYSKNPLIIYNSNLHKTDSINHCLNYIKALPTISLNKWESTNYINKTLTESNSNFMSNLPSITKKTYLNSLGLYCLNISSKDLFFKKLIALKYLNYIKIPKQKVTYLINQNHTPALNVDKVNIAKVLVNLPNTSFFESSDKFITTEGILKKTVKVIPTKNSSKTNWVILRNIVSLLKKELNKCDKNKTTFRSNNYVSFLKFINLNFFSVPNYKNLNENFQYKKSFLPLKIKNANKFSQKKIFKTKTYLWLSDFHIGGKDMYSNYSKIMVECSKFSRSAETSFKFL